MYKRQHPQVVACERGLLVRLGLRLGERGTLRPEALVRAALEYSGGQDPALSVTRTSLLQERGAVFADPLD